MRYNYYIVTFKNGKTVFASCSSEEEARILGMAVMIKRGFDREIESIVEATSLSRMAEVDYVA